MIELIKALEAALPHLQEKAQSDREQTSWHEDHEEDTPQWRAKHEKLAKDECTSHDIAIDAQTLLEDLKEYYKNE